MKNSFVNAKNAFSGKSSSGYIDIESSLLIKSQLEQIIEEPMKIAIIYGSSGTGKSLMLENIYKQNRHKKEIYFFSIPFFSENDFLNQIFLILAGNNPPNDIGISFSGIIKYCNSILDKREIVILLDEVQLYPDLILEQIRLISDTGVVKFILSIHNLNEKPILNELHFKRRIWSILELKNMHRHEMVSYIHHRLIEAKVPNMIHNIGDGDFKLIHKYTDGNYMLCNKIMYVIFGLCEEESSDNILDDAKNIFSKKIIELSALKLGLVNA